MKQKNVQFVPRVVLGQLATKGDFSLIGAHLKQHKLFTSVSGTGKSRMLASICAQLKNNRINFTLIDPHGDLCETTLQMFLETGFFNDMRAYEKLLYIPFGREKEHIPFNVLNQSCSPHNIAQFVLEAWKRSWSSSIGDGSATALENLLLCSVYTLVVNQKPLTDLYRLITDDVFRETLLPQVDDQFIRDFWKRKNATNLAESTLRRAFLLSFSPSLRYSLMQRENMINARYFMDNGISVLYDLSGVDPQAMRFLGSLITLSYEQAALSRSSLPEKKRKQHQIVIDEFAVFVSHSSDALEHILTQARKFGVTLNLACQTVSQVKAVEDALQNALHITFKMGHDDAAKIAPGFLDSTPKKNVSFLDRVFGLGDGDRVLPQDKEGQDRAAWARVIRELKRQECLVHVGEKTWKLHTLSVDDVPGNKRQLEHVKETYAKMLLTRQEDIEKQIQQGVPLHLAGKQSGDKAGKQQNVQPLGVTNHMVAWLPDEES